MKNFFPGIVWAILIFILSSIPSNKLHLPEFWDLFSLDKGAHAFFYFVLYIIWTKAFISADSTKSRIYIAIAFCCLIYGGLIELYQAFCISNRVGSWLDELANFIGVMVGYIYMNKKMSRASY